MKANILNKIINTRIKKIKKLGYNFGVDIPDRREVPVILPDINKGVIICEIKRGSPSEGLMNNINNPLSWAESYIKSGADILSILTDEDYFYGNINDLITIKEKFPKFPILRKDFLLYPEEIEVSYKAGADLVLLIVSALVDSSNDITLLNLMIKKAEAFGMLPLIEVHNQVELELILPLKPKLIGINSRDLNTMKIIKGYPYGLKYLIDPDINVIYESSVQSGTDSFFIGASSFNGLLVGSSIVKSQNIHKKITDIKTGFYTGINNKSIFYEKIFKKIYIDKKPAIKICGITNLEDAKLAVKLGADIIGFIIAKSPREIDLETAKKIANSLGDNVLKVCVVVDQNIPQVVNAIKQGFFHAVQFHGEIDNEKASSYGVCWYKAIRVKDENDFHHNYQSPIILYDTFTQGVTGGTGKLINKKLLNYAKKNNIDLCLAGGINPNNVAAIFKKFKPIMIDINSGLESSYGKKDPAKMKKFFNEIKLANLFP